MEEIEVAKTLDLFFNPTKTHPKWNAIDRIEQHISTLPNRVMGELIERGTPGLYTREITLPAGTLLTSKIHKTCHQFNVSMGAISVYNTVTDSDDLFFAGYHGLTLPGTRRVLYTHEETRWTTFHPTNRIDYNFMNLSNDEKQCIFDAIMREDIIQEYYNPLVINFDDGVFI